MVFSQKFVGFLTKNTWFFPNHGFPNVLPQNDGVLFLYCIIHQYPLAQAAHPAYKEALVYEVRPAGEAPRCGWVAGDINFIMTPGDIDIIHVYQYIIYKYIICMI